MGRPWRRGASVAAVVSVALGSLALPTACEWVLPAGEMLHPDALVQRCTSLAGATTPATRPLDAAVWSFAAGAAALVSTWVLDYRNQLDGVSTDA
jgi:hypothetical protein